MRMWMVDPKKMCRKHLLGEHVECHMFLGSLLKQKSINGFIIKNCLQPLALKQRHDLLVQEMISRGYNHKSILEYDPCILNYLPDIIKNYEVNVKDSTVDLITRCKDCNTLHM